MISRQNAKIRKLYFIIACKIYFLQFFSGCNHARLEMFCIIKSYYGVVYPAKICQGYALHLVGPLRCGVLWSVETEWNYHMGSVSDAIDAFEPSIEGETATVPRETLQSYPPAWQCSNTCRKTGRGILGNAEIGGLTPPAVLSRCCSFRLPFVSIDGTRPGSSAFPFLWRSQKMGRFTEGLKRCIVFSRWYPAINNMAANFGKKRRDQSCTPNIKLLEEEYLDIFTIQNMKNNLEGRVILNNENPGN